MRICAAAFLADEVVSRVRRTKQDLVFEQCQRRSDRVVEAVTEHCGGKRVGPGAATRLRGQVERDAKRLRPGNTISAAHLIRREPARPLSASEPAGVEGLDRSRLLDGTCLLPYGK